MELTSSTGMTFAPAFLAIVEVESVDESSITIISSMYSFARSYFFKEEMIPPMLDSSFLHGTQTEIF